MNKSSLKLKKRETSWKEIAGAVFSLGVIGGVIVSILINYGLSQKNAMLLGMPAPVVLAGTLIMAYWSDTFKENVEVVQRLPRELESWSVIIFILILAGGFTVGTIGVSAYQALFHSQVQSVCSTYGNQSGECQNITRYAP